MLNNILNTSVDVKVIGLVIAALFLKDRMGVYEIPTSFLIGGIIIFFLIYNVASDDAKRYKSPQLVVNNLHDCITPGRLLPLGKWIAISIGEIEGCEGHGTVISLGSCTHLNGDNISISGKVIRVPKRYLPSEVYDNLRCQNFIAPYYLQVEFVEKSDASKKVTMQEVYNQRNLSNTLLDFLNKDHDSTFKVIDMVGHIQDSLDKKKFLTFFSNKKKDDKENVE